jgi:Repeat of unknown function (DUF5648)
MARIVSRTLGCVVFWMAFSAHASFHTFQINEIYSNADGTIQFIELKESAGASGQNFLAEHTLTSSSGGNRKTFVFPNNLPSPNTAGKSVLIGTQGFAALGLVAPDYTVPDGFLFQPDGEVNYADVDTVHYTQLRGDGTTSIDRNGVPQANSPRNFAGQTATVPGAPSGVTEFYNTTLNFYFVTASAVEGASIDAGGSGPGWTRTGNVFKSGGPNAVCRFRGVPAGGGPPPASHFYTADADECNQVKLDPGWFFESLDFATTPALPGANGATCPAGLLPVYRAYNGRFAEHASNHRITANFAAYQQQIAAGWTGEGIVMCAQP